MGVLMGYSQGTQWVLEGYSRGAHRELTGYSRGTRGRECLGERESAVGVRVDRVVQILRKEHMRARACMRACGPLGI